MLNAINFWVLSILSMSLFGQEDDVFLPYMITTPSCASHGSGSVIIAFDDLSVTGDEVPTQYKPRALNNCPPHIGFEGSFANEEGIDYVEFCMLTDASADYKYYFYADGLAAGPYDFELYLEEDTYLSSCFDIEGQTLSLDAVHESFCNQNGLLSIQVSGGVEPYAIDWNDGVTGQFERYHMMQASYVPTVTDANGCTGTIYVEVTGPEELINLEFNTEAMTDCSCSGSLDGVISGGTSEEYSWILSRQPGSSGESQIIIQSGYTEEVTISNLCNGGYRLLVSDSECGYYEKIITISSYDLDVKLEEIAHSTACGGDDSNDDGRIKVGLSGEVDVLDEAIEWYFEDGTFVGNGRLVSGLSPGFYTVEIKYGQCVVSRTFEICCCGINKSDNCFVAPFVSPIVNFEVVDASNSNSQDGSIIIERVHADGIPQVTYMWLDGDRNVISYSQNLENQNPGKYILQYHNGCGEPQEESYVIGNMEYCEANPPSYHVSKNECVILDQKSGMLELASEGSTSLNNVHRITWSDGSNSNPLYVDQGGEYAVTITDDHGCEFYDSYFIEESYPLVGEILFSENSECKETLAPSLEIDIIDGSPPYTYQWSTGNTSSKTPLPINPDSKQYPPVNYFVNVTDACNQSQTFVYSFDCNDICPNDCISIKHVKLHSGDNCTDYCEGVDGLTEVFDVLYGPIPRTSNPLLCDYFTITSTCDDSNERYIQNDRPGGEDFAVFQGDKLIDGKKIWKIDHNSLRGEMGRVWNMTVENRTTGCQDYTQFNLPVNPCWSLRDWLNDNFAGGDGNPETVHINDCKMKCSQSNLWISFSFSDSGPGGTCIVDPGTVQTTTFNPLAITQTCDQCAIEAIESNNQLDLACVEPTTFQDICKFTCQDGSKLKVWFNEDPCELVFFHSKDIVLKPECPSCLNDSHTLSLVCGDCCNCSDITNSLIVPGDDQYVINFHTDSIFLAATIVDKYTEKVLYDTIHTSIIYFDDMELAFGVDTVSFLALYPQNDKVVVSCYSAHNSVLWYKSFEASELITYYVDYNSKKYVIHLKNITTSEITEYVLDHEGTVVLKTILGNEREIKHISSNVYYSQITKHHYIATSLRTSTTLKVPSTITLQHLTYNVHNYTYVAACTFTGSCSINGKTYTTKSNTYDMIFLIYNEDGQIITVKHFDLESNQIVKTITSLTEYSYMVDFYQIDHHIDTTSTQLDSIIYSEGSCGYSDIINIHSEESNNNLEASLLRSRMNEKKEISIFPNPAESVVYISHLPYEESSIQLLSLDGSVLIDKSTDSSSCILDIEAIVPGVYVVRIEGGTEQAQYTKLIKF